VRGWLKGSIVVLIAALVCAAMAPVVSATLPPPEESEGFYFELTPRKDARVIVYVHPQVGVAIIDTEMGPHGGARTHRPWGAVDYAARIPKTPIEGRIDLKIPGVLSIDGELTPVVEEGFDFDGSFHFTGKGGYLTFGRRHFAAWAADDPTTPCPDGCLGPHPSLFDYINSPITFTNHNTQILYSEQNRGGRLTRFQATHAEGIRGSGFDVHVLEWLPGGVAALRTLEVAGVNSDFDVSSTAEHPESATVKPPAPFSGTADYQSTGSIRSAGSGKLTGTLLVDLFGVKVRLAGARTKASLFNLTPGF
jgi:hypothetical protein